MLSGHLINFWLSTFIDVANLEGPFRIFFILNDASTFGVMEPFISGDCTTAVFANDFHPSMYSGQWVSTPYFNPAPPKKSSTHFCCLFFCSGVALIASHIS